jgi:hypothetical protein
VFFTIINGLLIVELNKSVDWSDLVSGENNLNPEKGALC